MLEVKIMGEPVEGKEEKEYDEWHLECKAKTLIEAEEIKKDPKLMAALQPYLKKKAEAITSIAQLREVASKKAKASS